MLFSEVELPLETVWKLLCAGQPPHHQTRHRRVDEGFSGCTQPRIVFGHPSVVADPRKRALHHPPPRQHLEAFGWHKPPPVHLLALLGPLRSPELGYLLGHRLFGLAHHLHAHAHNLLRPPLAPTLVAASTHRCERRPRRSRAGSSS